MVTLITPPKCFAIFCKKTAFIGLTVLLLMFFNNSWAKQITIETDRQTIEYGDIVTLNIVADFQVTAKSLNLALLEDQFEILGTQRSNNIQVINGTFKSSTRWTVQLLPKQEGQLIIPVFELENIKSQPLTLTVTPSNIENSGTALKRFFLEATIDQSKPYIQQQVIYTLRLFHQGRYVDGTIRPPKFGTMLSQPLKEQSIYQKKIQGQDYTVYEWVYALYPQSSGIIKIDPPLFNGRIQYAGQLRQVKEFAKSITLDVQPEPKLFGQQASNTWLPAKSLTLSENWTTPSAEEIRVGDTLTQTITMNVEHIKASQLPNLSLLPQTRYKVYPDKPQSKEQPSATGINSVKQYKRAIIPTQEGTLTLPEQSVYWWNTQTNKLDKTTLPAKQFEIKAALSDPQNLVDCALPSQNLTIKPNATATATPEPFLSVWPWLTAIFAVLWLMSLVILIKQKRQSTHIEARQDERALSHLAQSHQVDSQQAWSDIDSLCKLPAKQLYPALKQWLKTEHHVLHFSELNNPLLQTLIQQLEAHLYNQTPLDKTLKAQLANALKKLNEANGKNAAGLVKANKSTESKLADLYER